MLHAISQNKVFFLASAFTVAGAVMVISEPVAQAYQQSKGLPANQKCEDQLPELIKKLKFPGNGASHYNPWIRQCDYKYFQNGEISTYHWIPSLK